MALGDVDLRKLGNVAGDAGRKVADSTAAARGRIADAAGDAQERMKRTADQAKEKGADLKKTLLSRSRGDAVDLATLEPEAKLLYCQVLVGLAVVDGVLDPREIANLYLFASTVELDAEARAMLRREITGAQRAVDDGTSTDSPSEEGSAELYGLLEGDRREAVISLLVRDLVRISRVDQDASSLERERIVQVAGLAFPEAADKVVSAAEQLVLAEEEFAAGKITPNQLEAITKDVASKAAAFGAPIAAVSLAGGVSGLSAAGLTSGLAALGFGGILGLSAMVTGIGTVVILGVVVHQGARYLLGINERERAKRREYLIQQVLKNHQQAMAELTEDIAGLAHKMETYLSQTTRNEEHLALLRAELNAFQQALVDLQTSQAVFERGEPINAG